MGILTRNDIKSDSYCFHVFNLNDVIRNTIGAMLTHDVTIMDIRTQIAFLHEV